MSQSHDKKEPARNMGKIAFSLPDNGQSQLHNLLAFSQVDRGSCEFLVLLHYHCYQHQLTVVVFCIEVTRLNASLPFQFAELLNGILSHHFVRFQLSNQLT